MAGKVVTILGCGSMGLAISKGILSALACADSNPVPTGSIKLSRLIACVRSPESVTRAKDFFQQECLKLAKGRTGDEAQRENCEITLPELDVWQQNKNADAVELADLVLLACQPSQASAILKDIRVRQALHNKLLVSICIGMDVSHILSLLTAPPQSSSSSIKTNIKNTKIVAIRENFYVVHAMPNLASDLAASATVLSSSSDTVAPVPTAEHQALVEWLFSCIGTITYVPPQLMNVASITGAATIAFFATALEGVVQGAIDIGLSPQVALELAAQSMKGTAEMALDGSRSPPETGILNSPRQIRERVMTPNGVTERGVKVLQTAQTEHTFAEAMRQAVHRAYELGSAKGSSSLSHKHTEK